MSKLNSSSRRGMTVQSLGKAVRLISMIPVLAALSVAAHATSPSKDLAVIYPPLTDVSSNGTFVMSSNSKAPTGFVAAPMPDPDALAPRVLGATGPEVSPSLFRNTRTYRGDGFTPDSTPQNSQSKRVSLPGISVKVPLY